MKTCTKCHETKTPDEFYRDPDGKDGLRASCKVCESARSRGWRDANPERMKANGRRWDLRSKYGITPEQYDDLLEAQEGCCACCGSSVPGGRHKDSAFYVDHDHPTDRVRGLLCSDCNLGIGKLGDNIAGLARAMAYLQRSNSS